jgi:hypothetical protein
LIREWTINIQNNGMLGDVAEYLVVGELTLLKVASLYIYNEALVK